MRLFFAMLASIVLVGCQTTSSNQIAKPSEIASRSITVSPQYLDRCAANFNISYEYGIPYSERSHYRLQGLNHAGIDLRTNRDAGDIVLAAAPGRVLDFVSVSDGEKNLAIKHFLAIKDGASISFYSPYTKYSHWDKALVKEGDWVEGGQPIATSGYRYKPGSSWGYAPEHLHFEIDFRNKFPVHLLREYLDGSLDVARLEKPLGSISNNYWNYEAREDVNPHYFWHDGVGKMATFDPKRHSWPNTKRDDYPDKVETMKFVLPLIRPGCNPVLDAYLKQRYGYAG